MSRAVDPARTLVLSVGVERYAYGTEMNLPGAAAEAARFARWSIRCGVPPARVLLACSWLADAQAPDGVRLVGTTERELYDAVRKIAGDDGDLLLLFWCGHGVVNEAGQRALFTSDATRDDKRNIIVDELLSYLRSTSLTGFGQQILLIDACANSVADMQFDENLPQTTMQKGNRERGVAQFAYFSAAQGQIAQFNKIEQSATFATTSLTWLERQPADAFPPDVGELTRHVDGVFEQLREVGRLRQIPVYQRVRNYDGSENQVRRLDGIWAPTGDEPSDADLVSRYLRTLAAQFDELYGPKPHVTLGLERGSRAPVAVPAALRREEEEMFAILGTRFALAPPGESPAPDAGQPVDDLGDFQARHRRVVLLGRSGAGKSSTLRRLVTDLAGEDTRIPIFAGLSEWDDPEAGLLEFLQARLRSLLQLALAERLPDLMSTGRVILLLDGLNEIPRLGRDAATGRLADPRVAAIAELATRPEWEAVGCVLTCRPKDFTGGPQWHDLHLLDLNHDQTQALVEAYFRDAPGFAEAFVTAVGRAERLHQLATNPFFLVRMLGYFWHRRTLSDRPGEILEIALAGALLREGDGAKEVRQRLGSLAFHMTANGESGPVDRQRAAGWLESDGATVWRMAEGAGLLTTSPRDVRFTHQLIQEFFTTDHLRNRPVTAALVETVAQPQFNEVWPAWAESDPALVDRLIPLLGDAAAGARRAATTILAALRDPRATDPLAGTLTDSDPAVRWTAALGLAALHDSRATLVLVERLREDESTAVRVSAAVALGDTGDERALRPLVETLVSARRGELSRATGRALGRLGDPRAVPDLIAALGDEEARYGAVDGLVAMGEAALDPLIEVLRHDRNATRRKNAASVLGLSHLPRAIPPLIEALGDDDRDVQGNSASALGYFGEPALGPLIEALDDSDEDVRTWALCALGYMRDPRTVPHLIQAMVGDTADAAGQATRSLRMCGDRAVAPLVELLHEDVDPETRWNAALALSGLGEAGITALVTAAGSDDSTTRLGAVAGLGEAANRIYFLELPDPRLAVSLNDALYDVDPAVRRVAAISLGRSGDARAVDALAAMVQADEPEIQAAALEQFGRIEDPAAVAALLTALRDADADIRRGACDALGRLFREPRSIRDAARDRIPAGLDPQTALIEVLTAWCDPSAAPPLIAALRAAVLPLIEALGDPDSRVADAASSALQRAAQPLATPASILSGDRSEDTDDEVSRLRSLVRETMVPLSGPDTVAALLAALDLLDDEPDDRWEPLPAVIASLLGTLADRRAVPPLIRLLRGSQREVVTRASAALAELGGPEALEAILDRLTGPDRMTYDLAFSLMRDVLKLADDRTPALLLQAMRGAEWYTARDLTRILRALGERALVPLIAALADAGPDLAGHIAAALDPAEADLLILGDDVRWRPAVDALDLLSDSDLDILVAAADHDDETVARVAVALLERLGHPAAVRTPEPEPKPVERGVEELSDDDPAVRVQAAQSLGSRGVRAAAGPLTALLADQDSEVRGAAALALGQLGDRSVVDQLIPLLDDPGRPVVYRAAKALGMLGGAHTLRVLLGALDKDSVRTDAAEAIGEFDVETYREVGPSTLVDALFAALRHERRYDDDHNARTVYVAAQKVLTKLGEPARSMLLPALDDDHDAIRHLAVKVLGEGADLRALPVLEWMEENDHGEYVSGGGKPKHAARTARDLIQNAHRAREPLIESLASGDRLTRFGAAFQLALLDWRGATPVLIEALQDDDHRVRWGAARWLGTLQDERAVAPLVASLGDPDRTARDKVTEAVISFGPAAMPFVLSAVDAPDAGARAQAARIVGYSGGAGDIARLTAALDDPAVDVVMAAAWSLTRLADREVTGDIDSAEIGAALKNAFRTVEEKGRGGFDQWSIIDALERFDSAGVVDVLIEATGSSRRDSRMVAVRRLGKLGDRRAIEPLNRALSDEEWTVREDAADSLKPYADTSSVDPLLGLLSRETGLTCLAAIETLAEIADSRAAAPMVAQLRSQLDQVRAKAEDTIVALADDAAIVALVALVGEDLPDWFAYHGDAVSPPGLNALVRLGARAAGPLVEVLGDTVRGGRAAEALRRLGAEAVPALVDGLRVPADDEPAETCADILARMGEPGWSALAAAITDERPVVRAGAAYGLWLAHEEGTIPVLLGALTDTEVDVRGYAALTLGNLGKTPVIEPVAALADDPNLEVRACAAATLARLGDDRAVPLFREALANDGAPARLTTGLIGLYQIDAGVEPLIEALSNESAGLREAGAVALAKVGDPRALPALDLAAEDPVTGAAAAEAARTIRAHREPSPRFSPLDDEREPD